MIYLDLPPFNPVANNTRSTTVVPRWAMTLGRVLLCFPWMDESNTTTTHTNGITKATIKEIVVKVGSRVVFGPISGAELDKINRYRGIFDDSQHLTLDFTERDALSVMAKEMGGYDLPALGNEDLFIEVVNTATTGTPILYALGGFTALQFDPAKPKQGDQLVKKLLVFQVPTTGGNKLSWMPNLRGALVQRVHFAYAGANWSNEHDGNLARVEVKKNGTVVWSNVRCLDNRFLQREQRKAPQYNLYTLDWVHDNVHSAALDTRDANSLEFNLTLKANALVTAFVECLDIPRNL